jgi:hypothetical protein
MYDPLDELKCAQATRHQADISVVDGTRKRAGAERVQRDRDF